MNRNPLRNTLAAAMFAATTLVWSFGPADAGDWKLSVTPYAWATGIGVDARLDGRQVIDQDIPVSDVLNDLDTIAQLRLEVQHRRYSLLVDLFDATLSDETHGVALPQGAGTADLNSVIGMTILDAAVSYDLSGGRQGLCLYGGARVLDQDATVNATFAPASGPAASQRYETSDTVVDGLLGVRFRHRLARRWVWQMQGDASTGGTDYTWSLAPSLNYVFGAAGRFAISGGYRVMTVNFADANGVDPSLKLSGMLVGLRTTF